MALYTVYSTPRPEVRTELLLIPFTHKTGEGGRKAEVRGGGGRGSAKEKESGERMFSAKLVRRETREVEVHANLANFANIVWV